MLDIITHISEQRSIRLEHYEKARNSLFSVLKNSGVKNVSIAYYGGGDSGDVEDMEVNFVEDLDLIPNFDNTMISWPSFSTSYSNCGKRKYNVSMSDITVSEALNRQVFILLEEHHGGWEINEGSSGTITIEVEDSSIVIEHNENYMEVIEHVTTIDIGTSAGTVNIEEL